MHLRGMHYTIQGVSKIYAITSGITSIYESHKIVYINTGMEMHSTRDKALKTTA
jgi:hypothetical protein